jgi:hypothetical protein
MYECYTQPIKVYWKKTGTLMLQKNCFNMLVGSRLQLGLCFNGKIDSFRSFYGSLRA